MNKKILLVLSALALCFCFILSACSPIGNNNNNQSDHENSDDDTYFTVTFDSQGGSAVESQSVLAGNPVTAPKSPTRENFDFDGWFRSADEDAAMWNFSTDRVNDNITLYAHWSRQNEEPPVQNETETLIYEPNEAGTGLIVKGDSGQAANIVIPAEHDNLPVVAIDDSAFAHSRHTSDILSVTIPDSVTEIGKNAFYSQQAIETVNIGSDSKLEKIGNNAFSGNYSLKSIYLPASLNVLGDSVFNNCGGLNTITVAEENTSFSGAGNCLIDLKTSTLIRGSNNSVIPDSVTKIGEAAFRRATLDTLTIPRSVTYIEKYAISDSAIKKIIYEGNAEEWAALMAASSKYWRNEDVEVVYSDTTESTLILVAYFSATGNTENVANSITAFVEGTLYEIEPQIPYSKEDLNYSDKSTRATREQNDPDARPEIADRVENMDEYDIIFLGYPIWWGSAPKIIYTFLESYDFSGKTIIPFCTSGSSGIGNSANSLHSLTEGANWLGGGSFYASTTQSAIRSWLDGLEY